MYLPLRSAVPTMHGISYITTKYTKKKSTTKLFSNGYLFDICTAACRTFWNIVGHGLLLVFIYVALHDPNNINTKRIQHIMDAILIDSSLNPLSSIATNIKTKRMSPAIIEYLVIFLYYS